MSDRFVTEVETDTGTFLLEGTEIELPEAFIERSFPSAEGQRDGSEVTGHLNSSDAAKKLSETIEGVGGVVKKSIETMKPQEYEVEFSIGMDLKTGLPFVVSNKISGGIKVTLKWKSFSEKAE